jgi:hypothetical protein
MKNQTSSPVLLSAIPETKKGLTALEKSVQAACTKAVKVNGFADSAGCFDFTALSERLYDELNVQMQSDMEGHIDTLAFEWFKMWSGRFKYTD